MPSISRSLSGKAIHLHLGEGRPADLIDKNLLDKAGRSARTLIKEGPLRATLVALAPGGELKEHQAEGPITVHVLSGKILFQIEGEEWALEAGDLLSLAANVPHAVESAEGGEFLLTVASVR